MYRLSLLWLAFSSLLFSQPNQVARHVIFASSLPANCSPKTGDIYFLTSGIFEVCVSTNTWLAAIAVAPGVVGHVLRSDGANWKDAQLLYSDLGSAPVTSGTQTFTATGVSTFTPGTGVNRVWVQVWGGGGGGAGGNNAASAGSGGSGGGYAEGWCTVTPGVGVTATVGIGGIAGPANTVGGAGGNSSFGSCLTATGAAAQVSISTNSAGGIDNRMTSIATISTASNPLLSIKSAIAPQPCSGWTYVAGASSIMTLYDSSGGCGALPPTVDGAGFGAGHAYKGGGGGGSGSFNAATTRVGGPGGFSVLGGAGGTGDGSTNGTPNGTCTAGTQPGGGGGGGAANATVKSAGCAGGAGQVTVWW